MRNALVILLVGMVLILGCAAAKIKELQPGMTTEKVEELLGKPDGYQNTAGWVTYTYHDLSDVGRSVDYALIFDPDGNLVRWDQIGEYRPKVTPVPVMVFPFPGAPR